MLPPDDIDILGPADIPTDLDAIMEDPTLMTAMTADAQSLSELRVESRASNGTREEDNVTFRRQMEDITSSLLEKALQG